MPSVYNKHGVFLGFIMLFLVHRTAFYSFIKRFIVHFSLAVLCK